MPPAKRAATSSKSTAAKPKATTAKPATAKPAASAGAARSSSARASGRAAAAGATRSRSTSGGAAKAGTASAGARARTSSSAKSAAATSDARVEALAERVRKLNERIIDAGKQTGESTLTSYEKALKAIASAVERGPGSSDIDWISHLATSQANFIRDFTKAWTSATRGMLK